MKIKIKNPVLRYLVATAIFLFFIPAGIVCVYVIGRLVALSSGLVTLFPGENFLGSTPCFMEYVCVGLMSLSMLAIISAVILLLIAVISILFWPIIRKIARKLE